MVIGQPLQSAFLVRVRAAVRRIFGWLPVRRSVQGVALWMPWEHRLPDYAKLDPTYGQNLVAIAAELAREVGPYGFVDIGANIGDSALQVLAVAPDVSVLLVEADPYYLRYLRRNLRGRADCQIEPVLVLAESSGTSALAPVRTGGTTRFAAGESSAPRRSVSVGELRQNARSLLSVRLVKCDTDGLDTTLAPASARVWLDQVPIVFFEYDEKLSRIAGDEAPDRVFDELDRLGYRTFAVWDNFGNPLAVAGPAETKALLPGMRAAIARTDYYYWDVAAAHHTDEVGQAILRRAVEVQTGA